MNEIELLNTIKNRIGTEFVGDDCAYLKDLGIVITQDSLAENIHFMREWCTPRQLGYKAVTVNISDILASGAEPKYISISLSLPKDISPSFVDEFYLGAISALEGAAICGGDLTGSSKDIMISITAIGTTKNRNISSRKNAKVGYSVITHGVYGSSAKGLEELKEGKTSGKFIKTHLEPQLNLEFSSYISKNIVEPYAMMDTSDGLADALYKIADESGVKIIVDYTKIPLEKGVTKAQVLYGGEDYNLVAAIPTKYIKYVPNAVLIGNVVENDGIKIDISGEKISDYNQIKAYNHFGE